MADLFDAKIRAADYPTGIPSVSFAYESPAGPRMNKAGVRISYEGQYPLEYKSVVTWPESGNYEVSVRAGILAAATRNGVPLFGGVFKLEAIQYDEIHSSELAVLIAAREAARSLVAILTKQ